MEVEEQTTPISKIPIQLVPEAVMKYWQEYKNKKSLTSHGKMLLREWGIIPKMKRGRKTLPISEEERIERMSFDFQY